MDYIALGATVQFFCSKRFLVDSHRKTSKHQRALGSRSEQLIPHTSRTFLKSSDTDFVEKVTKAVLSADAVHDTFCFVCFYQPAFCRVCVFILWTSCLLINK